MPIFPVLKLCNTFILIRKYLTHSVESIPFLSIFETDEICFELYLLKDILLFPELSKLGN